MPARWMLRICKTPSRITGIIIGELTLKLKDEIIKSCPLTDDARLNKRIEEVYES
jgi:hypothetical protein